VILAAGVEGGELLVGLDDALALGVGGGSLFLPGAMRKVRGSKT
jgi:hypothetical protein